MLTQAWTQLRYHPQQAALWRTKSRFCAVWAGRGSGKTELARRRIIRYLPVKKPWPDPIYFYALPTYGQAARVAWRPLKALVPQNWIRSISESGMTITTVFGSKLYVVGLDNPARIEGVQWDGCVIDESSDQNPRTFDLSVVPALTHRDGWCWRIGVPKRFGRGAQEFHSFCDMALKGLEIPGLDFKAEGYTWPSRDILTPEQLAWAKHTFDAVDFREQFEASWETAGGLIFHAFNENKNVTKSCSYRPELPIIVGSDFNVSPMSWVIGHRIGGDLEIFDEISMMNTNTRAALDRLAYKYGEHKNGFRFYGDAAGRARHTSANTSDYMQIRNDKRFEDSRCYYPKANPAVADRLAATNAKLESADGEIGLRIHPRCKRLIEDLKNRSYKEGTKEPDDGPLQGHMTDALGYIIHKIWPIRLRIGDTVPGIETATY